ncbi:deoxyguanosine kinase [Pelagirhabdus alkalitolerans]|uniref:Deoxyguanosine kinase n=1 Tax=Pelagirhabdus alkalitolerans TaxID=1612202 RepID=A0A1G6NGQ1_9BACI|nr:deoxynucleoside kinase [Pelagirhabdus alkalitolerans]SDC66467.1 deoxyguanosine kinase [Pelagirhabdus alkalitolerans]
MTRVPFIAVEGPIGVGKTSLARKIAKRFDFHLLKEIVEENPFLGKFYDDIEAWSFQTEMFFLCNRYKQLEDIEKDYLKTDKPVISDYHIMKNMIFAKRTLAQNQYEKYEQIYHILTKDMPKPNVLIYLDASLDTLLDRIDKRARAVEEKIQPSYLEQLKQDYKQYMDAFEKNHPDVPVIRIDGDTIDFIKHQDDLEAIFDQIKPYLYEGVQNS